MGRCCVPEMCRTHTSLTAVLKDRDLTGSGFKVFALHEEQKLIQTHSIELGSQHQSPSANKYLHFLPFSFCPGGKMSLMGGGGRRGAIIPMSTVIFVCFLGCLPAH